MFLHVMYHAVQVAVNLLTYSELFFKNNLMMSQSRDKKRDNKLTTPPSLGRNILGGGSIVFFCGMSQNLLGWIPHSPIFFGICILAPNS